MFEDHGGGRFGDWGIHMLDQMLYLIDEPIHSVWGQVRSIRSGEVDDYSKVLITFESGLTAQVEASTFSPITLPKWYACGDKGAIIVPEITGNNASMRCIKKATESVTDSIIYPNSNVDIRPYNDYKVTEWEKVDLPLSPYLRIGHPFTKMPPQLSTAQKIL